MHTKTLQKVSQLKDELHSTRSGPDSQCSPAHARPDATLKVRIKGLSKLGGSLAAEDVDSTRKSGCLLSL